MSYFEEIRKTYKEAKAKLIEAMEEGQEVNLLEEMEDETGYTDEFYELPQQTMASKHGFALHYYLHAVSLKDGEIYVTGLEIEEAETEKFQLGSIDYGTACYIIDDVLNLL
jgi:hypothetical protein